MLFSWLTQKIFSWLIQKIFQWQPPKRPICKRLANEIKFMLDNPEFPEFPLKHGPIAEDMYTWQFIIAGPPDSPFDGGDFLLSLYLAEFPFRPPQITFLTKIYHPNINSEGNVSLGILEREDWSHTITVVEVLMCIFSVLEEPDLDNALVPQIANIFKKDRSKYEKVARSWTEKYAMEEYSWLL